MLRGYAVQERFGDAVALSLVRHPEPGSYPLQPHILRIGRPDMEGVQRFNEWEEFDPMQAGPEPTLRLRMDEALELASALAELQHGNAELRSLRRDYEAERARVDKLIGTLSTVAIDRAAS